MKKKILIVVPSFSIGGTIVSLNSLLSLIDTSKYDIDIFALNRSGEYLNRLPNCSILAENMWLSHITKDLGIVKNTINKVVKVVRFICRKLGVSVVPLLCKLDNRQIKFSQYDTVVNYAESVVETVSHYPAKRRVTWIHCDYKRYLSLVDNRDQTKAYQAFDKVICVSEFAKGVFTECMPKMASKVVAIHNVINKDDIIQKANEPIDDDRFKTDDFTIVSAGRLDPVKQFHLVPQLAADIKKQTERKFVWYIIGGYRGFDAYVENIKSDIVKLGVSDNVILLGEKSNVYPYMSKADLYVSTSLSESFPLVINEAKALGIPIVTNNFGSACESVKDGIDGFIVSLGDGEMCEKLVALISGNEELPIINRDSVFTEKNQQILEKIECVL